MEYMKIARATPFEGAAQINICEVFGASPKKPIILKIAVTGERPVSITAKGLPDGLILKDGIVTGSVESEGNYEVTFKAENALGSDEKRVIFEIKEGNVLIAPLLGFTSWNAFAENVTQKDIENTAKRLDELGISEYGYSYVNLDSGWQWKRDEDGVIEPNPKFPDMKKMTDELHRRGFKCGIYSTPMLTAWGCPPEYESIPGTTSGEPDPMWGDVMGGIGKVHNEEANARRWAEWGFDYLKYDWRPTDPTNAERMRQALLATDRDFGFCVTVQADPLYHNYWTKYVNSFRNNPDTAGSYENLLSVYSTYFGFLPYLGERGHYFDLDMLDIGDCRCAIVKGDMTEDEMITAFSMRVMLGSPIQISSTLETASDFEISLYCNEEILAVHQDAAFTAAKPKLIYDRGNISVHVYEKELSDGTYAIGIFNLGQRGFITMTLEQEAVIRDLWKKTDLPARRQWNERMNAHSAFIFKSPVRLSSVFPKMH